ncbi:rhodanese domain-containing dual specificity protein phosphatase [Phytophthora cinnamomi]|uniref:rhodanese domain-containing dual specificity protein phosphatase n=1 Tax=Phytophthora cinnamomi TaxID=4785 RepID=UPI003559C855|nr:rhodanese domain-containing dual specificity protein phosphatase [Phytophthora cinnamomi]
MRESQPATRMSMSVMNQADPNGRELRLWLLSAATHRGVTYYRIAGRFTSSGQTWEVGHRYSEFLKLRDQLVKFLATSTDKCPGCRNYLHSIQRFDFPKKHLFASRAPPVVNYRVKALRSFLNLLASWAFSKTPKCPTCGGYAFDVVRNFVLEGDDVSADADMSSIRESFRVEAFSEHNLAGSRGPAHTRTHSWMTASSAGDPDMTQSMHVPQSRQPRPSQGPSLRQAPPPRSSTRTPTATQQQQQQHRQRSRRQNDSYDAYDAFNDYLPERQSKVPKKATQSSMEQKVESGKFKSMPLQESIEERQRRRQQEEEDAADAYQQKLRKHRSEPRNLSARRPLAESELSVGTSAFESPRSSRRAMSRGGSNAESFISDVSMAAEPIFIHGDELQRYGLSDDERKARSAASSVYSGDDEIELTGVAMASPPRAPKKSSNNLWQPWELARVA